MAIVDSYSFYSGNIPVKIAIESDRNEFVLIYKVSISQISANTDIVLDKIREELIEKVKLGIGDITDPKKLDFVKEKFKKTIINLIKKYFPDISDETLDFFTTYLMHKSFGLGKVEILMKDKDLEEIVINNAEEPIWVYHHKYGWLKTNVLLKDEGLVKHYSSLIGRKVGRSITLLTPLLDATLETGDRVNATLNPISSKGNTITIRKFSSDPITITKFIQNQVMSYSTAALIWLGVEYESSVLISGGTASGKTSVLNAVGEFFPPNQRIISVEDSVSGDSEIVYKDKGVIKKSTIGNLIDSQIKIEKIVLHDGTEIAENKDVEILSMDNYGKISLAKPSSFIRHKVKKPLIEIRLSSGRKITVTKDHSLFSLVDNKIKEVSGSEIKEGTFLATPRKIEYEGSFKIIDLSIHLDKFEDCMVSGNVIKRLIQEHGLDLVRNKSNRQYYRREGIVPVAVFKKLLSYIKEEDKKSLSIVTKRSHKEGRTQLPLLINIDNNFATIVGMWLADGCYDIRSVLISDPAKESWEILHKFANIFGARVRPHSDKVTAVINSKIIKVLFKDILELKGNAYTKRIPIWAFNLNKELSSSLLKGYFSGDGTVKKNEICVNSASRGLLNDVQTLLLRFEILLRVSWKLNKDKTYESRIGCSKFLKKFKIDIGFVQNYKNVKLNKICDRKPSDSSDIIPLAKNTYLKLKHILGKGFKENMPYTSWKSWHGNYKNSHIGRSYFSLLVRNLDISSISLVDPEIRNIVNLSKNDIFWDKVIEAKEIDFEGYVYDLSVPERENFICNNIIAHNTREITLPKYLHWVPMITRLPNIEGKGGVSMLDLIINSLRMRPDRIMVGEIRRKEEAETLFEAMHTGHSVYATLHANSAEETVNRLTNPPINVPRTLLPAIGMVLVMYRNRRTGIRRIFQIAEITNESNPNVLLQYDISQDKILTANESVKFMPDLEIQTGMSKNEINLDLTNKINILKWMVKKNITDLDEIGRVIATYYTNKEGLLKFISKN